MEEISPPITTTASGWEMNAPPPVRPSAIGVSARIVAAAVIRMGRSRRRAPPSSASRGESPAARYWLTRSISTIALVTTMPISISIPIREATPSGVPVTSSSAMAPVAAKGTDTSRISGCSRLRKVTTMSR